MGVKLGDALIIIRGDKSKLGDDLGSAEKETQSWASRLGGKTNKLVVTAILGGAAAATTAVVGIGAAALNASSQIKNATNQIQTQLGLSREEAAEFGDTIKTVYGNNFGDSIEDVGQAIIDTRNQMDRFGQLSQKELGAATERALALRDAFGTEVAESTQAANALMENFGLTADEAFDFVTAGMQAGLNNSGDFLDTIGEYSVQFRDSGASAEEFFSVLDTGLQAGMLGTDKAADLFKEFRLRIQDGSESTAEALKNLGLSAQDIQQGLADGSMTVMDVYREVSKGIRSADDEQMAFQAGVALMGSQFEDLGETAVRSIDTLELTMEDIGDMAGDVGAQYDNFGDKFEGIKRKALMALVPIGDKMLDLVDKALPSIEGAFTALGEALGPLMAGLGFLMEGDLDGFFEGVWFAVERLARALGFTEDEAGDLADVITLLVEGYIQWLQLQFRALANITQNVLIPAFRTIVRWLADFLPLAIQYLSNLWIETLAPALAMIQKYIAEVLLPKLAELGQWLLEHLPIALQFLSDLWINTLYPAIQAVADFIMNALVPALMDIYRWVAENIIPILQAFAEFLMTNLPPIIAEVSAFIREMFGIVVRWVQDNWPLIQETIQTVMAFIQGIIQTVVGYITSFWEEHGARILAHAQTIWNTIKTVVETVIQTVLGIIIGIMEIINGRWDEGWAKIQEVLSVAWEKIKEIIVAVLASIVENVVPVALDALEALWNVALIALRTLAEAAWEGIKALFFTALNAIKSIVENIWEGIKDKFSEGIEGAKGLIEAGFDAIIGFIEGLYDAFKRVGKNIVEAIKQGIADAWDGLTSWFDDRLGDLTGLLPFSPPKNPSSPLRKLPEAGRNIVRELLEAMEIEAPKLQIALRDMLAPGGALASADAAGGRGSGSITYQLTAHYANYQSESSLRDDVRMLRMLSRGE